MLLQHLRHSQSRSLSGVPQLVLPQIPIVVQRFHQNHRNSMNRLNHPKHHNLLNRANLFNPQKSINCPSPFNLPYPLSHSKHRHPLYTIHNPLHLLNPLNPYKHLNPLSPHNRRIYAKRTVPLCLQIRNKFHCLVRDIF